MYFQELNGGLFRTSGILLGQQSRPCPVDVRGTHSCCCLKHSVEPGMSLSRQSSHDSNQAPIASSRRCVQDWAGNVFWGVTGMYRLNSFALFLMH